MSPPDPSTRTASEADAEAVYRAVDAIIRDPDADGGPLLSLVSRDPGHPTTLLDRVRGRLRGDLAGRDDLEFRALVALCWYGPKEGGLPPPDVLDRFLAWAREVDDAADRVLELALAHGCGCGRPPIPRGREGWEGHWDRAVMGLGFLAATPIAQIHRWLVSKNGFSKERWDLGEAAGKQYPPPEARIIASVLLSDAGLTRRGLDLVVERDGETGRVAVTYRDRRAIVPGAGLAFKALAPVALRPDGRDPLALPGDVAVVVRSDRGGPTVATRDGRKAERLDEVGTRFVVEGGGFEVSPATERDCRRVAVEPDPASGGVRASFEVETASVDCGSCHVFEADGQMDARRPGRDDVKIPAATRVVVRVNHDRARIVFPGGELILDDANPRVEIDMRGAEVREWQCACGRECCREVHRIDGWDPTGPVDLRSFVASAIKGPKAGAIATGSLGQGIYFAHLARSEGVRVAAVEVWRCCETKGLARGESCRRCAREAGPETMRRTTRDLLIQGGGDGPAGYERVALLRCDNHLGHWSTLRPGADPPEGLELDNLFDIPRPGRRDGPDDDPKRRIAWAACPLCGRVRGVRRGRHQWTWAWRRIDGPDGGQSLWNGRPMIDRDGRDDDADERGGRDEF